MGRKRRLDRARRIGACTLACGVLGGAAGVVAVRAAGSETTEQASVFVPIVEYCLHSPTGRPTSRPLST